MSIKELLADIIDHKRVSKTEILEKLDVFLLVNRITKDEYKEYVQRVNDVYDDGDGSILL